jgi:hypothetical protein
MNAITALLNTDFGNPDGLYDNNLQNYFLDQDYWDKIVENKTYFVVGRKGTGKSSIYNWIHNKQSEREVIISNLSFKNFPFERLLRLSDDDFTRPNQYQSIWKNIILSEFAKQIVLNQNISNISDSYKEIKNFVDFKYGKELKDLHVQITTHTDKGDVGLQFRGIGLSSSYERSTEIGDGLNNITEINNRLKELILNVISESANGYLIQFDQLDDNYTFYINKQPYFESLISLFKVIYTLNAELMGANPKVKIIAYLRSDIFYQFSNHDPDSAKFDYHTFILNWAIINRTDWMNPPLLQLMNIRIENSIKELSGRGSFKYIFNNNFIGLKDNDKAIDPFKFIVHRTFHRPRDLVQFCIKIKEEAHEKNKLDHTVIRSAEKEYSSWLLEELRNEIAPIIKATDTLFIFLRLFGTRVFSSDEFIRKFIESRNKNIKKSPQALLRYLYSLGMIQNVNITSSRTEYFSIIRNERSRYEPKMRATLHPGIIKGLHAFETD